MLSIMNVKVLQQKIMRLTTKAGKSLNAGQQANPEQYFKMGSDRLIQVVVTAGFVSQAFKSSFSSFSR